MAKNTQQIARCIFRILFLLAHPKVYCDVVTVVLTEFPQCRWRRRMRQVFLPVPRWFEVADLCRQD